MAKSFRKDTQNSDRCGGIPNFEDFMNPKEAPAAKTHHFPAAIQKIRQASLNAEFGDKKNMALRKRVREPGMKNSF